MLELPAEIDFHPLKLRVGIYVFTLFSVFQTLGCPTSFSNEHGKRMRWARLVLREPVTGLPLLPGTDRQIGSEVVQRATFH
jgi:hypothetical protein